MHVTEAKEAIPRWIEPVGLQGANFASLRRAKYLLPF
jgi:hypothetical protein